MCDSKYDKIPMTIDKSFFKKAKKPIVNRALLSPKQHINLLSTPRPNPPKPKEKRKKKPPPIKPPEMCSPRLDQLAMPTRKLMESVLQAYHDKFDPERVITLAKRIHIVSTQRQARTVPKAKERKQKKKRKKPSKKEKITIEKRLAQEWLRNQINTSSFLVLLYVKYKPEYAPNYKQLLVALKIMRLLRIKKGKNYPKYTKRYLLKICEQIAVLLDAICPANLQKLGDVAAKETEIEDRKHICWKVHSGLSIFGVEVQGEGESGEEEEDEGVEEGYGEHGEGVDDKMFKEDEIHRLEAMLAELEEQEADEDEDMADHGMDYTPGLAEIKEEDETVDEIDLDKRIPLDTSGLGDDEDVEGGDKDDDDGKGGRKSEGKGGEDDDAGADATGGIDGAADDGADRDGNAGDDDNAGGKDDGVAAEGGGVGEGGKDGDVTAEDGEVFKQALDNLVEAEEPVMVKAEAGPGLSARRVYRGEEGEEGLVEGEAMRNRDEEEDEEEGGEEVTELKIIDGHPPGTVCYLTYKIYCNWLTEFGENIQKYGKCLKKFRTMFEYSEAKQVDLMKNILINWSKYFTDCRQFEEKLTKYFRGKAITYCEKCLVDYSMDDLPEDHEIPRELVDAMKSTSVWAEMLKEAEEACKIIESKKAPSPDELSLVSVGTIEITEVNRSIRSSESFMVLEEIDDNYFSKDDDQTGPCGSCSRKKL